MYKVETSQVTNTNKAKSVLSSTGLSATSSVRRPSNRDSSFKNSVVSNTKISSKKVEASDRTNKKLDVASKNVALNTFVTNDGIKNALIAKNVLCVSCAKNVLIPCHDNCLAKYKLNVHSNFQNTEVSLLVLAQSKSLDTTPVVSKTKITAVTPLSAKNKVVQIVLWIVDSGCLKHMTSDQSLLKIFIEKFMGTVRFRSDHFTAITGYGDYVQRNITICHVYYIERLGHNLFSVGQFCDGDLEVAFRSKTCYVRNMEGDDLLTRDRESNLYTISIPDMAASSLVCLMSKASSTNSWLWHHRLSHLNFDTINDLTKHDLVDGLPKFKYDKDHLCSTLVASYGVGMRVVMAYGGVDGDDEMMMVAVVLVVVVEVAARGGGDRVAESMNSPSKEDLDNLFGPMYDEYFEKKSSDMPINSAAQQVHNQEDSSSTSLIDIEAHEAPPIVTTSEEQTSLISLTMADEFYQDV
ncbi:integrase, catalytic region, zinc finger, CCHC-type containing protein [Tanacetum coccineum]